MSSSISSECGERTEEYFARDSDTLLFHGRQRWLHKAMFSCLQAHSNVTCDLPTAGIGVHFQSRNNLRSFRLTFLLQPLLHAASVGVINCYPFACVHIWSLLSTEQRNDFLEGVTAFLRVTQVSATEKNKNCPSKYCNLVHKNSIESVALLFRTEKGRAGKGRKAFFSCLLFYQVVCLLLPSIAAVSNEQTKQRPLVLTHTSSTFTRVQENALFPLLHLASPCLPRPRAPWVLVWSNAKARRPPCPFKTVAFHFFIAGRCPGAYEAKSIFEQHVNQQAEHVSTIYQHSAVRLYGNIPEIRKKKKKGTVTEHF